ncbi:hypothetical protein EDB85DRAFT_2123780, partial [Lactarius pseudohatsudake]
MSHSSRYRSATSCCEIGSAQVVNALIYPFPHDPIYTDPNGSTLIFRVTEIDSLIVSRIPTRSRPPDTYYNPVSKFPRFLVLSGAPLSAVLLVIFFDSTPTVEMTSPNHVGPDIEAQTTETQPTSPPHPTNTANPQLPTNADPQPQTTNLNTSQHYNWNPSTQQTADNSEVQRDGNYGDPSDGLWSMYLTEAEKQDTEVTESWKGDTDGILVFTGLFSATVAAFILESYKKLSPDSGDTTNALLTQISGQLVNISNDIPLAGVAAQSVPFKPTASAVRVNVLWFLSLILSLNCALSATLMQQWARRYRELAQRRGAFHRRGRMRAYIFDGINRFGLARAVATMPKLLHTSVFLFFAGLIEFLFPIYTPVAYTALGCIMVFALAYANLTVLPNIYLNCPYATPLSGFTWRISQFSVFGLLWTILKIEGLFRRSLSKLWSLSDQHVPEPDGLKKWRDMLENQIEIRRQWFSQGMRKSVESSAYRADSTVVTSALVWTLSALDEDKEIEDFAARIPGFFDSRVVSDATLAVLPLMSHQPNTDPIFGTRLYDLLKTCIPGTSTLEEKMRKNRLRVCMKCLWSFAKAYNQLGSSQVLPSYFTVALASPEITRLVRSEEDSSIRMIGRCVGAMVVHKLAADIDSRTVLVSHAELECLSAILGTDGRRGVELLLSQPGAVALANIISLVFDKVGTWATHTVSSDALHMVQQTLGILSRDLPAQESAELQLKQTITVFSGSDGKFERILVSRLLDLLNTCIQVTSPLTEEVRAGCLRVCLKGLWYFGRAFNQLGNSVPLSSYVCIAFTSPETTHRLREQRDPAVRVIMHCVEALVVNKLAADNTLRTDPTRNVELTCLSTILGIKSDDVKLLLRHPGAIEFTNIVSLAWANIDFPASVALPSDVPDVLRQTFCVLSQALPAELNSTMRLNQKNIPINTPDGVSSLAAEMYRSVLRTCLNGLWNLVRASSERGNSVPLPFYVYDAVANSVTTLRKRQVVDFTTSVMRHCIAALIVNKLADDSDIKSRTDPNRNLKLECLSAILGIKSDDVVLLLHHPGAIEFTNIVSLANIDPSASATLPSDVLDVLQQTFDILSQALPAELNSTMRLDQTDTLIDTSDGTPSLTVGVYRSVLRMCLNGLWNIVRVSNERGNSVPLPSYIYCAFNKSMMARRIHQAADSDLTTGVIRRCVGALVVNKLAADNNLCADPTGNSIKLECLSAILDITSDDATLLHRHPGAIEFTNIISLAWVNINSSTSARVPSDVLDVVQQTFGILYQVLPAELNVTTRLGQTDTLIDISDGTSSLTAGTYRSVLRICLNGLWNVVRASNERGNSAPLPPYVYCAFNNSVMACRIHQVTVHTSDTTGVIRRCAGALVVNKLAADIKSRTDQGIREVELGCLSAILDITGDDVTLLHRHPGAVEFTNMVFLALGDFCSVGVPSNVMDVVQQTFGLLSQALPAELNATIRLDHIDEMSSSDGTTSLTTEMYRSLLRVWMKNLWHSIREYNELGNSVPLPSYVWVAFTNPKMTRHIREQPD